MLQLSRRPHQRVILDVRKMKPETEFIAVTFCEIDTTPGYAIIGIDAPMDVAIIREEILDKETAARLAEIESGKATTAVESK